MLLDKCRHSCSERAEGSCSSGRRGASFVALAGANGEDTVTVNVNVHSAAKQIGSVKDAVNLLERSRMQKACCCTVGLVLNAAGRCER